MSQPPPSPVLPTSSLSPPAPSSPRPAAQRKYKTVFRGTGSIYSTIHLLLHGLFLVVQLLLLGLDVLLAHSHFIIPQLNVPFLDFGDVHA